MSRNADERSAEGEFADIVQKFSGSHRSLSQLAYRVIREAIMRGVLPPGKWLRQEWLAQQLGISRVPIHVALVQLEGEGLVDLYSHRGAKVRTLTSEQVSEIYRIRILLESYALRLSAPKQTREKLEALRTLAAQLDNRDALSETEFLEDRIHFYDLLYDRENNPMLVRLIADLRSQVGRMLLISPYGPNRKHVELIELVATGNLVKANEWLISHLEDVRRGIQPQVPDSASDAASAEST